MATLTAALLILGVGALLAGRLHVLLQMLQQEHYENARLHVWVHASAAACAPSSSTPRSSPPSRSGC